MLPEDLEVERLGEVVVRPAVAALLLVLVGEPRRKEAP